LAAPGWLTTAIQILAVLASIRVVFRRRVPAAVGAGLLALALGVAAWEVFGRGSYFIDARTFWGAGQAVWEGRDPYVDRRLLNPPPALPLFVVFALLPAPTFFAVWSVVLLIGHALLAPASQASVLSPGEAPEWKLGAAELLIYSAALVGSVSTRTALAVGQIPIVPAAGILLALAARQRGHPVLAGLGLALASVKVTSMIPFLVLFNRRKDVVTWATLAGAGLVMTFATTWPSDLPGRLAACLANIKRAGAPGENNDFSLANPLSADLIGLDHLIYHLGVRHRPTVQAAQWAGSLLLVTGIAWFLIRRPALPLAAGASIATCACPLFSYHRQYDLVFLALPLVYATGQSGKEEGRRRWAYRWVAVSILAVLYHRTSMLGSLMEMARQGGVRGRLVEILVLPMSTWLILTSLLLLVAVEGPRGRAPSATPAPPAPSFENAPAGRAPGSEGNLSGAGPS
jgi:hypothetical protein